MTGLAGFRSVMSNPSGYAFGRFVVDLRSASLRRDGAALPLRPKSFDVLVYLIGKHGQAVSKSELIDSIWRDVVVTENSLAQCIKEVRQVLGDEAQSMIETVAKRGYLFAPAVAALDESAEMAIIAAFPPLPDRPSIAVLPFTNMSGDPDQQHFADGISEDLITALSQIRWLFVIARNSTFVYRGRAVDVKQVARELGVRYVLEGSVRRSEHHVRVGAQLIDATTGTHTWAKRYDGELGDIFAVQDEITRNVAAAIEPQLLAAEGVRTLVRSPADPRRLGAGRAFAGAFLAYDPGRLRNGDRRT